MATERFIAPLPRAVTGRIARNPLPAFLAAAVTALLLAAPWLDERLVWCGWLAAAAALAQVGRLRGWWGEAWVLATAALALALAFHWTPHVLAYAMNTDVAVGLMIAAPIVLWDAVRIALPLWLCARIEPDARRAWLPAGLAAVVAETVMPAVFPWKLGYSQIAWTPVIQSVDLFGPEFSTFMFFAHAGATLWLFDVARGAIGGMRPGAGLGPVAVVVCAMNLAYGCSAMAWWERAAAAAPTFDVALVQANPEDEDGVAALRSLTVALCGNNARVPDLVCWPECSGGCYDADLGSLADPDRVERMSRGVNGGMRPLEEPVCPLLFGGKIFHGHPEKPSALHQSAILVDEAQHIRGCYHKRHLMPFGEYVPGEHLYPDVRLSFSMDDELTPGSEPRVLACGDRARLGVMLCYEDMISAAATSLTRNSANVLVSLINGSAFTEPLTLRQHRLLAQLRAVECRRAFVRCAATGETCVISPLGRVESRLPLHDRGALEATIPLVTGLTLYARTGRMFPLLAAGALALLVVRRRIRPPSPAAGCGRSPRGSPAS